MSRNLDPEVSRKVAKAIELMEPDEGDGLPLAAAARRVGLSRSTLRHRLDAPVDPVARGGDGLPEYPGTAEVEIVERDYTHLEKLSTYPVGDLHVGSPQHAADQLDEWLAYLVATPAVSLLNTGDNANCAIPGSKSDVIQEKLSVGDARRLVTEKFRPLAETDILDAIIDGNHEVRVLNATGDSPNAPVAEALGVNYNPSHLLVRYLVGDQKYDLYLRHGHGGGGSVGAQVNNLEKQQGIIDADIYVSGHTHTQVAFVLDHFRPRETVERRKRLFVCSGSFVGYEAYAARAGYKPAHIGAPRIFMDGRKWDCHASV